MLIGKCEPPGVPPTGWPPSQIGMKTKGGAGLLGMISLDRSKMVLAKHHGLGNDFLILIDGDDSFRLSAADVRILCDRHRGIGADGVIRITRGRDGVDVVMELRNAGGEAAETSGNGLRCVAQAALHEGLVDAQAESMVVLTGAGSLKVTYRPAALKGLGEASVEMGASSVEILSSDEWMLLGAPTSDDTLAPRSGGDVPQNLLAGCGAGITAACRVRIGNPHVVLFCEDALAVDIAAVGSRLDRSVAGGTNVEVVSVGPRTSEIAMVVWERGVGETLACGTGACAAAAAARALGVSGDSVKVSSPGGVLRVELSGDPLAPRAVLSGPVQRVGVVEVDLDSLLLASVDEVGEEQVEVSAAT